MNKADVIAFFDRCAPEWDADMIRNEPVIQTILDNADVCAGIDVLDVACGTGVLIPDYLKRSVRSVTGIDISPEMIRIAKKKFPQESVKLICGDVESVQLNRQFDCVMVYNAFPHFPNPKGANRSRAGQSHRRPGGCYRRWPGPRSRRRRCPGWTHRTCRRPGRTP